MISFKCSAYLGLIALQSLFMGCAAAQSISQDEPIPAHSSADASPATVHIDAFQFKPNQLKIKKGTTVLFINKDIVPHTVTPKPDAQFAPTGHIKGAEQRAVVFEKAGTQSYSCDFHPSMTGTIIVE